MADGLGKLRNIGATIERRLREIGIETPEQLAAVGPVEAWRRIRARNPGTTVPVCYYLYSLEGALRDLDWRELPPRVKDRLLREAKGNAAR